MKIVKLGEIASIQTGKIDVNRAVEGGRYPFFTCSREVYKIDDAPFEGKAILVAGNGDLNVKYYEGKFNAYQRTYFLLVKDEGEVCPKYIYWFLESYVGQLRSESFGSTIKYIKMGNLTDVELLLPAIPEQRAVVARLDSAFAEINELEANLTEKRCCVDALLKSIMHSSFTQNVDFPESRIVSSSKRRSRSYSLGQVCRMYQPKTISIRQLTVGGSYKVYGANGVIGRYDKYNHEESQLLVTCRGATCGSVNVSEPFAWINGNAMVVKPDTGLVTFEYLKYAFVGGLDLSPAITGSAQPQITRQSLEVIRIDVPSLEEQRRIVLKLDSVIVEIEGLRDRVAIASEDLLALGRSLLSSAFAKESDVA
jgi:restriction endonuclease S subunit